MNTAAKREFDVRVADQSDFLEIVRVTNSAYMVEDFCIQGDRTDLADVRSRMQNGRFLVIGDPVHPSTLQGAVYMSITDGRGYLGTLAVDPKRQGNGMARRLVAAVEDQCRLAGCSFVDITVVNLRKELFPFYTKLGFAASDVMPFPRPEMAIQALHLVQMTKPLRPLEDL